MKTTLLRWMLVSVAFIVVAVPASAQKRIDLPTENVSVSLQSSPEGAKVYLDGQLICLSTPTVVSIPCKGVVITGKKSEEYKVVPRSIEASAMKLTFKKDGYITKEEIFKPQISKVKKKYVFQWPTNVLCELRPSAQIIYSKDPSIPAGEAKKRVSRDNAGATDLERTILRWYFDSAPQGARVYWRVISSIPAEVKNTNELWLGTTPFEETRSFNIQGLTYENSRDVQIEIKVSRKGYIDQSKRFNVRQAIDQQEISSFFDLIKADEE